MAPETVFDHPSGRVAVILGQSLEVLRLLPDKSVDVILTDPPYSPAVHENLGKERRNDGVSSREALAFPPMTLEAITVLAAEYVRVCRGWILSFADHETAGDWGRAIRGAGGAWLRTGQWVKTNPMPQMTCDRPGVGSEQIVIAHATGKKMSWNGRSRADVWRGSRDIPGEGKQAQHPNQKPAWLVQALLGAFVPAGGLVLDAFAGSGTTAYAALLTSRAPGQKTLDASCAKCNKTREDEYVSPLPENVRVICSDMDPRWTSHTIARIQPLLAA